MIVGSVGELFTVSVAAVVVVGEPVAAVVKVAVWQTFTVWFAGCVVMTGGVGEFTVSVAAVVVAVPTVFVNTARYWFPLCAKAVVKLSVVEVAPETLLNVAPPSVLTCHCTVGVGEPVAAAVKLAVWPAVTVWFAGCVVIVGYATSRLPLSSTARLWTVKRPEVAGVKT